MAITLGFDPKDEGSTPSSSSVVRKGVLMKEYESVEEVMEDLFIKVVDRLNMLARIPEQEDKDHISENTMENWRDDALMLMRAIQEISVESGVLYEELCYFIERG